MNGSHLTQNEAELYAKGRKSIRHYGPTQQSPLRDKTTSEPAGQSPNSHYIVCSVNYTICVVYSRQWYESY
jgi:hypothetical protein